MNSINEILNLLRNTDYRDLRYAKPEVDYEFLLNEIKDKLEKIRDAITLEDATYNFEILSEISEILQIAKFKLHLEVPEMFNNIIRNLDRVDDQELRERIIKILKDKGVEEILNESII